MKAILTIAIAAAGLTACSPALGPTTAGLAELEFVEACAQIADFEATKAHVKSAGWESVRTDSDPQLKAVVLQGVQQDSQVVGGFTSLDGGKVKDTYLYRNVTNANRMAYRKTLDERDFHLILMTNTMPYNRAQYGCFLYDFQEGYQLALADQSGMIEEWLQSPPTGYKDVEGLTSARVWSGDALPEHLRLIGVGASNINDSRKVRKNIGYYGRSWFTLSAVVPKDESE